MEGLADYSNAVTDGSQRGRWAEDKRLLVTFYTKAVHNKFKSNEEGRHVCDEKDYIKIMIPGDRNSMIDTPVTKEHKARFAERYRAFKAVNEDVESGTPLKVWPQMTIGQVAELNYLNIQTVEQLAGLDDLHGQKIPGYNDLKRRAQMFLDSAKSEAENSKMAAELEKRDVEIAALKEQMNQIIAGQSAAPKGRAKK